MTLDDAAAGRSRVIPTGPSIEAWRAMSLEAREAFLLDVCAALSDPRDLMTEGRPHKKAKSRAVDLLGLHFKAMRREVYLAEEMAVVYPGEESFSPDVLAVVDVPQIEDDERMAWVVADEGRGLDVVLEVLHRGDRNKDLVRNVERYAHLGIPEYFVYDRAQQRIHGFRLAAAGARRYQRIVPQAGRHSSLVLGVDLAVQEGSLRFFQGMAELFGTENLIDRLASMVGRLEATAETATATADKATAMAGVEAAKAAAALDGLRAGARSAFETRFGGMTAAMQQQVERCADSVTLTGWLLDVLSATRAPSFT
jgi:Uma2 family endonuclease